MHYHAIRAATASVPQSELIDQMFALRARQFHDRRGWSVEVRGGREVDAFDQQDPIYILVEDGRGRLFASLRLLPTTGPHMLANVFPEVMGGLEPLRDTAIWESSRFCVDTTAARAYGADGVNLATRHVLLGLFETAAAIRLSNIVSVYDLGVERILARAGCVFRRLGPVVRYDRGLRTVASLFEVGPHVIAALGRDEAPLHHAA